MPDVAPVESVESSRPTSLKSLEGKNYADLPEEIEVRDKSLMTTFRNLSGRTKDTKIEWSGYITKDQLGGLSLGHIRPGEESKSSIVHIKDLSGLSRVLPDQREYSLGLDNYLRSEQSDDNPLVIFGKDLDSIDKTKLRPGIQIVPNQEFFALVHTHQGKDSFSPQDAYMLAEQGFRPDGRPEIPISIVVGPEEMYMMVIPKDGNVKNTGGVPSPAGFMEGLNLSQKMHGLSLEAKEKFIDDYIVNLCRERNFALYKGNLNEGVLRRMEVGISKKLKEMGYTQVQIRRLEFNPSIPDPDLQIAAIFSLNKEKGGEATLEEGQFIAQDFVSFMEEKTGSKIKITTGSSNRFFILTEDETKDLAEVRCNSTGIEIIFPRKSFHGDKEAQKTQENTIASLEEYYKQRLSDRLPLSEN